MFRQRDLWGDTMQYHTTVVVFKNILNSKISFLSISVFELQHLFDFILDFIKPSNFLFFNQIKFKKCGYHRLLRKIEWAIEFYSNLKFFEI